MVLPSLPVVSDIAITVHLVSLVSQSVMAWIVEQLLTTIAAAPEMPASI